MTRTAIGYRMGGDADGEAVSDVAMYYRADGTAWVAGLWTVTATVRDRSGSLVFDSTGEYDGSTATSRVWCDRPRKRRRRGGAAGVTSCDRVSPFRS